MHSFALLAALAGTAVAVPASLGSCVNVKAAILASYSDCADTEILTHCLSGLDDPAQEYIESCHIQAGCPAALAESEARSVFSRCNSMIAGADLRRRFGEAPQPTQFFFPRQAQQEEGECINLETFSTTDCDTVTSDGKLKTTNCHDTSATRKKCKPGKTCTMDSDGRDICMDLKDDLDVAGIIIAIVFAALITIGIGALTFLCCKDRKEQKRLQAKAEATALARAATKKKRAAEVRQPLMSQAPGQHQQQPPPQQYGMGPDTSALGGGDPFHDQNRS